MLTYKQAETKMAKFMKAKIDFLKEKGVYMSASNLDTWTEEERVEKQCLENDIRKYGEELASMPQFFDIMSPWMVDVKGAGEGCDLEATLKDLKHAGNAASVVDSAFAQHGALAEQVKRFIEKEGFEITDRGAGSGGWHVGVPCNTSDMRRLCGSIHMHFHKAVEAELISIVVHFWDWRLPTLRNDFAVERYFSDP